MGVQAPIDCGAEPQRPAFTIEKYKGRLPRRCYDRPDWQALNRDAVQARTAYTLQQIAAAAGLEAGLGVRFLSSNSILFIPLGHRCSSAALLDCCQLGGASMPFDALVCQLSVVRDCLETDFKQFLDRSAYVSFRTQTLNVVDGVVANCGAETPRVHRHYEALYGAAISTDSGLRSTYHLQLALTHHDLSQEQDFALYTRRVDRLQNALQQSKKKVFVYVHPLLGPRDFQEQQAELADAFQTFALFMAQRFTAIFGLFFILVRRNEPGTEEASALLLQTPVCRVYVVYANANFIDAGGPFSGNCEHEVQTLAQHIRETEAWLHTQAWPQQAAPAQREGPSLAAPPHAFGAATQNHYLEAHAQARALAAALTACGKPDIATPPPTMYKIYFPLFDHHESRTNEVRMTHEGLLAHPRVTLVDQPALADYLVFCQNHLVDHSPFHPRFRPIKDQYKNKTILLDYDDNPEQVFDADDFRWRLYFKRSCVDRESGRAMEYALPILPTAYCATDAMCEAPFDPDQPRNLDIACLFDDHVIDSPYFGWIRGRLLKFARRLAAQHPLAMQIGPVSESGTVGRSTIHPRYRQCLFASKIILTANPDHWEGDSRLWEALASGALVFVDRLHAPIKHPLVDAEHLIFYDLTDEGMAILERKILYYLCHDGERQQIGLQGRAFVLQHHRSINRVSAILEELERTQPMPVPRNHAASTVDIIVSIATGYTEIDQYSQFISTLRRTGARCPVLLGISDGPEFEPVKRYLLDNAVNYFIVPPIRPPNKVVNGYRFAQYQQWLRDLDFRYALMMDFRDAYFQRDPFEEVEAHMKDCDLYLMSEFQYLTVGNHPNGMNYAWVSEPFGKTAADAIADRAILNSGAILGRRSAVMAFLETIAGVTAQQNFEFADQGTLNYLAHNGHLDHCGRIKTTRAGQSLVNNCGFSEIDLLQSGRALLAHELAQIAFIPRDAQGRLELYRDHAGWVLDDDGNISSVVHQYDRFMPAMEAFVARLAQYQYPEQVFVNDGQRRYQGEKYTLSSRAGLKPDAVQRLIERILSLPLDKKPLLLVDTRFKRGFAFAYGVLNHELQFRLQTLQQALGPSPDDAEPSYRFCQQWGYRVYLVDEHELFLTTDPSPPSSQTLEGFRQASLQARLWTRTPTDLAPTAARQVTP